MRNKNEDAFFALVRVGLFPIHGEGGMINDSLFENVDWEKVYKIAREQSIIGLVEAGIEWFKVNDPRFSIPRKCALQFIGKTMQLKQRNESMNVFISSLIEKMRDADIYTLLVKGQSVAQCYEEPLWRACGDVDLFLNGDNYEKAKKFLVPLASKVEMEYEGTKHLGMIINGWVVELHGNLRVGLPSRINRVLDDIQTETFNGGNVSSWMNGRTQIFTLGKENDIVYVFVHFFNHFYKEGIGLRQISDWCRLLWTYRDDLDVSKIENCIKEMGLTSEWKAFGAYAVEYLGMPADALPMYDSSSKWVRKAHLINEFIMNVGNMGHNRDMSHFSKYPYLVRKCVSMGRRVGDLINHARIFPLDSLWFFPRIMLNGVRSAIIGE